MLTKISKSNMSKFSEYIIYSVRLVQRNLRHSTSIINKILFNAPCPPLFHPYAIIYYFLNFDRFILI